MGQVMMISASLRHRQIRRRLGHSCVTPWRYLQIRTATENKQRGGTLPPPHLLTDKHSFNLLFNPSLTQASHFDNTESYLASQWLYGPLEIQGHINGDAWDVTPNSKEYALPRIVLDLPNSPLIQRS